jgi:hypothetical protein
MRITLTDPPTVRVTYTDGADVPIRHTLHIADLGGEFDWWCSCRLINAAPRATQANAEQDAVQVHKDQGLIISRPNSGGGLERDLEDLEAVDPQVRAAADRVAAVSDEIRTRARRNRVGADSAPTPDAVRVPSRVQARDEPCADPARCDVHQATSAPKPSGGGS